MTRRCDCTGCPTSESSITGAQSFDQWFDRAPGGREEFCARVGLDPNRPYVLFVGGALFPGTQTEAEYVANVWIPELRADPRLAELQVLVRPHPRRRAQWADVPFDGLAGVSVWPPADRVSMPVDEETRADFFDSLAHSDAVVGINTTAMIEAAAVGRRVQPVLPPVVRGLAERHLPLRLSPRGRRRNRGERRVVGGAPRAAGGDAGGPRGRVGGAASPIPRRVRAPPRAGSACAAARPRIDRGRGCASAEPSGPSFAPVALAAARARDGDERHPRLPLSTPPVAGERCGSSGGGSQARRPSRRSPRRSARAAQGGAADHSSRVTAAAPESRARAPRSRRRRAVPQATSSPCGRTNEPMNALDALLSRLPARQAPARADRRCSSNVRASSRKPPFSRRR